MFYSKFMKGIPKLIGCGIALTFFTLVSTAGTTTLGSNFNESDIPLGLTEEDRQKFIQEQKENTLLKQQQNWSTYEDPIQGIQFEYPSWWENIPEENSIGFYDKPIGKIASVNSFLPPLPEEMNTLDKFMRQMMSELRSSEDQNVSVNKTSTIGVDDLPAYRVESDRVSSFPSISPTKSIHYFTIDNNTGTGYMISFDTVKDKVQEDVPLFEKMVESFKILA